MTRIQEALLLAFVLLGIAVLAIVGVIPEQVAQYAPLAMVPWVIRREGGCSRRGCA